jgi:L-ascorbate metabolism protein UlaG (beta-lactamase superfamily)
MTKIYYLGHSAWAVETQRHYLLFDCVDENVSDGLPLAKGGVSLDLLKDKQVYIFFSHRHHDHNSPRLHRQSIKSGIGFTFLGDYSSSDADSTLSVKPRKCYEVGDIAVYTAGSTDAGVCFFVKADGLGIFHAGDNADWGDGDAANALYYKEIDYIAGLGFATDLAFVPVCTFSGHRPPDMTKGAMYALDKLKPKLSFPMHANGREHLYEAFEQDLRRAGSPANIICAKQRGDTYEA